jgi:hypothetical protein
VRKREENALSKQAQFPLGEATFSGGKPELSFGRNEAQNLSNKSLTISNPFEDIIRIVVNQ